MNVEGSGMGCTTGVKEGAGWPEGVTPGRGEMSRDPPQPPPFKGSQQRGIIKLEERRC